MRDHTERLRQSPFRQRVGRKTLVEETERDLEVLIGKVFVEFFDVRRHNKPFVRDHTGREGRDVEVPVIFEHMFYLFA